MNWFPNSPFSPFLVHPGPMIPFDNGYSCSANKVGVAVESALATTSQDRLKVLAEVNARLEENACGWSDGISDHQGVYQQEIGLEMFFLGPARLDSFSERVVTTQHGDSNSQF